MQPPSLTQGMSRRGFLAASVAGSAVLVAGCSFNNTGKASKKGVARLRYSANNPPSLDPQYVSDGNGLLPQGLLEGLTVQNPAGTGADPAVAEKWTMSADGLTYTMNLRKDARWSNGDPVTAQDFEWTYQRLLNPTGAATNANNGASTFQAGLGIKGAADFLAGTLKDWSQVGIRVVDDHTLEFTLAAPNADFLFGLAHVSMVPLNRKAVEAHPKDWTQPANWVGNGPFTLKTWTTNSSMTLAPNTHYWDRGNVHLDSIEIIFNATNPVQAIQGFRNNEADIVPADPTTFQNDATLTKLLQRVSHFLVDHLTVMWSAHPAFQDVNVRKALSLALDREALAKTHPLNSAPGVSLVTDRVPGWDASMGTPFDLDQAKQLLSDAGYPGGKGIPQVLLLSYAADPALDAIAQMWGTLGLKVKEDVVDAGVYSDRRWKPLGRDQVGFYLNSFAAPFTQSNYLNVMWGASFVQQMSLPVAAWQEYQAVQADKKLSGSAISAKLASIMTTSASPEANQFASMVTQFNGEPDAGKRASLFQQASSLRESMYLFLPYRWGDICYLVKENVRGAHFRPSVDPFYLKGISVT